VSPTTDSAIGRSVERAGAGTASIGSGRRLTRLIVGLIVAVMLVGGELFLRRVRPLPDPAPRQILWSSPSFSVDSMGAVRHIPNQRIRVAMAYGPELLLDKGFRTNNLGLAAPADYPEKPGIDRSAERYAFVGDSYVIGLGGEPWMAPLEERFRAAGRDISLYNLGITAASVRHHQRLLNSVARQLSFTHIVAVLTSDAFMRIEWVPLSSEREIRLCRPEESADICRSRPAIAIFDYDASPEEILSYAADLRHGPPPVEFARRSQIVRRVEDVISRGWRRVPWGQPLPRLDSKDEIDGNLEALAGIRHDFPDLPILLIQFPLLDEATAGRYRWNLKDRVEPLGIRYVSGMDVCGWSADMFYPREAHPNDLGYRHFARCLEERILVPSPASK
jgi:hypothetical protein